MYPYRRLLEVSCRTVFTAAVIALAAAVVYLALGGRVAEAPELTTPVRDAVPTGVPEVDEPRVLTMLATAYSHGCGNGDGFTATMTRPRPGVVAVDPAVIPLGTELYVEGYGRARAEDTGGLIKGERIDVFFETRSRAIEWGRRMVEVEILETVN